MPNKNLWESREVHFSPFASVVLTEQQFDQFMDDMCEKFWNGMFHAFFDLAISSTGQTMEISGWPWWYPKRLARRAVINVAINHDIGGSAEYFTQTTYLANRNRVTEVAQNRREHEGND